MYIENDTNKMGEYCKEIKKKQTNFLATPNQ